MALNGFTIGGSKSATTAPASSPVKKGGALSGFSIGVKAVPKEAEGISGDSAMKGFTAPLSSVFGSPAPVDTGGAFDKFFSINKIPPLPQPTYLGVGKETASTIPSQLENHDDTLLGIAKNTVAGIPEAAKKVSKAINDVVIKAPADLLDDSKFLREASAGIDAGDVSGNFGQNVLQKLMIGTATIKGLTGGLYEPPPELANTNPDLLDKGLNAVTEGLGMAVGMGAIGRVLGATATSGKVVKGLTDFVNRFPKVSKYIAPYIAPFVENAAGFAAYSQLDPNLGGNLAERSKRLVEAVATAPLYVALGAIKNPGFGLPASYALGFGMAKLSGATNEDAAVSGAAFAFLDAAGRSTGHRGLAPKEINAKMGEEALKVLNRYATDVKLTDKSTPSQIDAVFNRAVHQSSPELGGNPQQFEAAKSAYDFLTRGKAAEKTPAETSAELLSNEVKDIVDTHGPDVARVTITEKLGVDQRVADKLIKAALKPRGEKDIALASDKALANLSPVKRPTTMEEAADRYKRDVLDVSSKKGEATIIGADNLKDHFGNDYDIKNHPIYSSAANELFNRALKENKDPTVKFTVGGPGAGKSDFVVNHIKKDFKGTIYDSTGWKYEGGMKDQIARAEAAGKKVELYGVIPNIERAKAYTYKREANGEHPVTDTAFNRGHSGAIETMIKAIEDGHTVKVLDTRNIRTKEEAMNAKYVKNPLATLKEVRYTEDNVRERTQHITRDTADRDLERGGPEGSSGVPTKDRPDQGLDGSGETKTRGLSQSVEDAVLAKKLAESLGDLPEYNTVDMKAQAKKANELISADYEQAKRIAMGLEPAPEGLLSSVMFKAVELKAIKDHDIGTLTDLATQSLILEHATEAGQFIAGFKNHDTESPVKAIADVKKAREEAATKRTGDVKKAKKAVVDEIKAEIKKKAPKKQSWGEFVDSITC